MPEAEFFLAGNRYSVPDFGGGYLPEISKVGSHSKLGQTD